MAELSKQKAKTWKAFSTLIRTRDCVEYGRLHPEFNELMAPCVTCGRVYPYKSLQAGHFCPGRKNSILFLEYNCHAQCYGCNCGRNGNVINYYPFMLNRYGQETIDELMLLNNTELKFTVEDLKRMELDFLKRSKEIIND